MGDWTVLKSWWAGDVIFYPIIEEHQFVGPEVPEFTISVRWQEGNLHDYLAGSKSQAHGWRYVMQWVDSAGKRRTVSSFGYSSEGQAREAAEEKATKIVKAQQPEKVYRFRPEV